MRKRRAHHILGRSADDSVVDVRFDRLLVIWECDAKRSSCHFLVEKLTKHVVSQP